MARGKSPAAVLFDCFGTLVDFEADRTALAYPETHGLLSAWGHDLTHSEFVQLWDLASRELAETASHTHVEHSMLDYAGAFSDRCGTTLSDTQCHELATTFGAEWRLGVHPLDGADELIQDLASVMRVGVVSNTNDTAMVPELLASYFPATTFDPVVLSVTHGWKKPHDSIYQAALDGLGCAPADVIFVGDSYEADFVGPSRIGLTALLIDPNRRHPIDDDNRLSSLLDLRDRLL